MTTSPTPPTPTPLCELENRIMDRFNQLEQQINVLQQEVQCIKRQTTKMDHHVTFVNSVYEKVEKPLHYVCSKVNRLIGNGGGDNDKNEEGGITMIE